METLNSMSKNFNAMSADCRNLIQSVKDFVVENGGKIKTYNIGGHDTIYAVGYFDAEELGEKYVYAVEVVNNRLLILTADIMHSFVVEYDENNEEDWYDVEGGEIFTLPTIFNIAEAINQYV